MVQFLLFQVRKADDPMRQHELDCFSRALGCDLEQIKVFDLLSGAPSEDQLAQADVVLLGGSGDFSVAEGGDWLPPALAAMRNLYELGKPTFASCWGFQAMAKALGGSVVTDESRAELGSLDVRLTPAGRRDPLFGPLGDRFVALMGHQDCVDRLPPQAVLLASSDKVENQAFCFPGKPIYCTQFHPELNRAALIDRVRAYPVYVQSITGDSFDQFERHCREAPATDQLLSRFMQMLPPNLRHSQTRRRLLRD